MRTLRVLDKENKPRVRSACKLNVVDLYVKLEPNSRSTLSFLAINRMREKIRSQIVCSKVNKTRQAY